MPASRPSPFAYTVVRVVPHVEREEFLNAGIVLFCRPRRYLAGRVQLDEARLGALARDCDPALVRPHLEAIPLLCAGDPAAGPISRLSQAERFHWLSAPSSTIVQRSPVHTGLTIDPAATLEHLFRSLVMAAE